jgi:RimJ/RimL family protein N-acetyltransferase
MQTPDMPGIIFETRRLTGRHIDSADLEAMQLVYGDADAMRWVGDGTAITPAGCARWLEVTLENYRRRGYGMTALVWRESGEVVGFCGLVHPGDQPEAEIKYALRRSYWGRGLATEAARAMLAYGEQSLGLDYVMATTAPENIASHKVLLKAGMVRGDLVRNEDGSMTRLFEWRAGKL